MTRDVLNNINREPEALTEHVQVLEESEDMFISEPVSLMRGRYERHYVRESGGWKFSSMRFVTPWPPQPDGSKAIRLYRNNEKSYMELENNGYFTTN